MDLPVTQGFALTFCKPQKIVSCPWAAEAVFYLYKNMIWQSGWRSLTCYSAHNCGDMSVRPAGIFLLFFTFVLSLAVVIR